MNISQSTITKLGHTSLDFQITINKSDFHVWELKLLSLAQVTLTNAPAYGQELHANNKNKENNCQNTLHLHITKQIN